VGDERPASGFLAHVRGLHSVDDVTLLLHFYARSLGHQLLLHADFTRLFVALGFLTVRRTKVSRYLVVGLE